MKLQCTEPGCGTLIQTAISDTEIAPRLMAQHVERQHGSIESRHSKTLAKCREAFGSIVAGAKIAKSQARILHNEVSDLLKMPYVAEEMKNVSHLDTDGGKAIPVHQDVPPAEPGGDISSDIERSREDSDA